jgi:hypothetical protein
MSVDCSTSLTSVVAGNQTLVPAMDEITRQLHLFLRPVQVTFPLEFAGHGIRIEND